MQHLQEAESDFWMQVRAGEKVYFPKEVECTNSPQKVLECFLHQQISDGNLQLS